jgi:amino acid adenylation domain-containing protein
MTPENLPAYLEASAKARPDHPAVVDPAGWSLTYAELDRRSNALAAHLVAQGVRKGDRVGVVLPKSAASVTALFAIMKAGAAYVPVDHSSPVERGRRILDDCQVRAAVVDAGSIGVVPPGASAVIVGPPPAGADGAEFEAVVRQSAERPAVESTQADLAYILYTSGSTGIPKGVMLTHENAVSFVEWCASVFEPTGEDRFSSHAPFHFDLSVLDIYVSVKHGATLYLIGEDLGKDPRELAKFIAENALTVWYSTPSILTLLAQFGRLDERDYSSLRLVLFAGEVFPVKHLRAVTELWPRAAYYNLYGPTETNVCTFARIPLPVPPDRVTPYPIGWPCSHCDDLVLDGDGEEVTAGEEGLLYIAGASVFPGYWNRPEQNARVFIERRGRRWYNTGDVVRQDGDGFVYVGRRDRMVKRRGYRIELGEIERGLYRHPMIREAAVVATADDGSGIRITAYLSTGAEHRPSVIELKSFSAGHLPSYMSPDAFVVLDALPRTSTDKVDYQQLTRLAQGTAPAVQG